MIIINGVGGQTANVKAYHSQVIYYNPETLMADALSGRGFIVMLCGCTCWVNLLMTQVYSYINKCAMFSNECSPTAMSEGFPRESLLIFGSKE